MTSTEIAQKPNKEFMHQVSDGCACAICGDTARPLALHLLARSYSRDDAIPKGFLAMSMSVEAMQGVFPVCDHCAPTCPTCGLPVATGKVLKFKRAVKAQNGQGVCPEHGSDSLGKRIGAIFTRTLKAWSRKQP